jgi:DNA-directed RNA polymerase subunit M/transcription elongation factor TFIIS
MKNIHVLPTENYSPLVHSTNKYGGLFLSRYYSPMKEMGDSYQNIYITTDEEIKEGDWILDNILANKKPIKVTKELLEDGFLKEDKRIILTTDQDLIKDGVQAIDDEFLEWFVKNPNCEEVEVRYEVLKPFQSIDKGYILRLPDTDVLEEPKQETLEEVECNNCGYLMSLTEDESVYACYNSECTSCYEEYEEEPKQETLEEAAERYVEQITTIEFGEAHNAPHRVKSFIAGANWQQERMYSEEEVLKLLITFSDDRTFLKKDVAVQWFEQFKKK